MSPAPEPGGGFAISGPDEDGNLAEPAPERTPLEPPIGPGS